MPLAFAREIARIVLPRPKPAAQWLAAGVVITAEWRGRHLLEVRPPNQADGVQALASLGPCLATLPELTGSAQPILTIPHALQPQVVRAAVVARALTGPVGRLNSLVEQLALGDHAENALRGGILHVATLPSGTRLIGVSGALLRYTTSGAWSIALRYTGFRKPARLGVLVDSLGRTWVAQYSLNPKRDQIVNLYRSDDDGQNFAVVRRFEAGSIRHIHFIQQDPCDGSLWLGTGDSDGESGIWRSLDGEHWDCIGEGSQLWRAVGLAFVDDAVLWGTDAGTDADHFANVAVRWSRSSQRAEIEQLVHAPVHGIASVAGQRVVLATGCEGGANESDAAVHVWLRAATGGWRQVASWAAGPQPYRLQYAIASFANGQAHCEDLWVQLRGTAKMPLGIIKLALDPAEWP